MANQEKVAYSLSLRHKLRRFVRHAINQSVSLCVITLLLTGAAMAQDKGWPRVMTAPTGKLVYYQPQVDSWNNFSEIFLRMAITVTPSGGQTYPGILTAKMHTVPDTDSHTVQLDDLQLTSTNFPSQSPEKSAQLDGIVRSILPPTMSMVVSLDLLIASTAKPAPPTTTLKNDPPVLFISMRPAILLQLDGNPVMGPIANSSLQFVVNANWPLFLDKSANKYYLFDSVGWLTSSSLDFGWAPIAVLPPTMSSVPLDPNWGGLKPYIPAPPGSAAKYPDVYSSTTPAEIVIFHGPPEFAPIPNTQLLYATNTGSNVFKYAPNGMLYYLTGGRWFSAQGALGPWTFASNSLPQDFRNIPSSSPAGRVLAAVPGTPQAEDAVLLAQIPTTATVNPAAAAAAVKVSYSGAPQFSPITGTSLSYATNTPNKVVQVGDLYYLCFQGVWFLSSTPQGPWQTAPSVPPVIYTIPPSSPVYNITYVTQTTVSNGTVQASYTAGYLGMFIAGVAVGAVLTSGTGYYYPPYVGVGVGMYPAYYPCVHTYGASAMYNPYTGAYGVSHSASSPYGSASWGSSYNPTTGTYAHGATASTAYGTQKVATAYNPYTGTSAATHQGSNAYGSWGSSEVSNGNKSAYTQHETNANGSVGTVQGSQGGKGAATSTAYGNTAAGKSSNGDMYAGHDGNVYKNTGSGWQSYNNGSWNSVQKPTSQQDAQAQQKSQQEQQNYKSSGSTSDSYNHPSSTATSSEHPSSSSDSYSHPSSSSSSSSDMDKQAQDRQRGAQQSSNYSHDNSGWGGGGGGGRGRR